MAFDYSLHAAEALAALSTGSVDGAFGVGSINRVLLSSAERGLNTFVPEKEGETGGVKDGGGREKEKAERYCSVGGCSNTVDGRGLCAMHCKRICRRGSNCKKHSKISTGNVDAAYDVDSSVGVLLSAAAHGLNTLVPQNVHERRGRPSGSWNKPALAAEAGSAGTVLECGLGLKIGDGGGARKRGRPPGSKNKSTNPNQPLLPRKGWRPPGKKGKKRRGGGCKDVLG